MPSSPLILFSHRCLIITLPAIKCSYPVFCTHFLNYIFNVWDWKCVTNCIAIDVPIVNCETYPITTTFTFFDENYWLDMGLLQLHNMFHSCGLTREIWKHWVYLSSNSSNSCCCSTVKWAGVSRSVRWLGSSFGVSTSIVVFRKWISPNSLSWLLIMEHEFASGVSVINSVSTAMLANCDSKLGMSEIQKALNWLTQALLYPRRIDVG